MFFQQLNTDQQLEYFAEKFSEMTQGRTNGVVKGDILLDYLRSSQVIGLFNRENKMVAGYVLRRTLPLRLLDFVPEGVQITDRLPKQSDWEQFGELTCVWKSKEVSGLFMAAVFWPKALWTCFLSGKKYVLGHNQAKGLDKAYTRAGPETLYCGPSIVGLPSRLFYYTKARLLLYIAQSLLLDSPRRLHKILCRRSSKS